MDLFFLYFSVLIYSQQLQIHQSRFLMNFGQLRYVQMDFTQVPHLAIKDLQIEVILVEMKIVVDNEYVWHFLEAIFKH
jgi:hypothetical protein